MPSYILTGAPGAGKTAVLRLLETRGYAVVEEAATDVIALANDRSPACTLALSRYLGFTTSRLLADEISRMTAEGRYEATAFLIRNQGFVTGHGDRRPADQLRGLAHLRAAPPARYTAS
jgi:predicted ATPase